MPRSDVRGLTCSEMAGSVPSVEWVEVFALGVDTFGGEGLSVQWDSLPFLEYAFSPKVSIYAGSSIVELYCIV